MEEGVGDSYPRGEAAGGNECRVGSKSRGSRGWRVGGLLGVGAGDRIFRARDGGGGIGGMGWQSNRMMGVVGRGGGMLRYYWMHGGESVKEVSTCTCARDDAAERDEKEGDG